MAYDKYSRPSAKRHNYLIDKMTLANLTLHLANEELWDDNRAVVAEWKAESEMYRAKVYNLLKVVEELTRNKNDN